MYLGVLNNILKLGGYAAQDPPGAPKFNPPADVTGVNAPDAKVIPKQNLLTKLVRDRLYNNLTPVGYGDMFDRVFSAVVKNEKSEGRDDIPTIRSDAWAMYLGLPQEEDNFTESRYKPTNAEDSNAIYYDFSKISKLNLLPEYSELDAAYPSFGQTGAVGVRDNNPDHDANVLGKYKVSLGEDEERGRYLSYYDVWDLDKSGGVGQPFEVYGRIYEDEMQAAYQDDLEKAKKTYKQYTGQNIDDIFKDEQVVSNENIVGMAGGNFINFEDKKTGLSFSKDKETGEIKVYSNKLKGYPIGTVTGAGLEVNPFKLNFKEVDYDFKETSESTHYKQGGIVIPQYKYGGNVKNNMNPPILSKELLEYLRKLEESGQPLTAEQLQALGLPGDYSEYKGDSSDLPLPSGDVEGGVMTLDEGVSEGDAGLETNNFSDITQGNLKQAKLAANLGLGAMGTMNMSQDRPGVGTGMLAGAGMGLLNGGLLGGLIGAGVGGVQSAMKTANHDVALEEQNRNMYESATVQPRSFELGGAIEPMLGAEYTPIQAEKTDKGKEVLILPSLDIVDSGAEESHEDMDKEEITDVVPESTYVLSSSEDMQLDLKEVADTIVGLGISSYTEDGDNYGGHFIKFEDIFGDEGEITFAEAANKVKDKYSTKSEEEGDIFTKATNEDNKSSRMPIIQELIMLQEGMRQQEEGVMNTEEEVIPQYKKGGYVKKYQLGGMTEDPPNSGDYFLPNLLINSPTLMTSFPTSRSTDMMGPLATVSAPKLNPGMQVPQAGLQNPYNEPDGSVPNMVAPDGKRPGMSPASLLPSLGLNEVSSNREGRNPIADVMDSGSNDTQSGDSIFDRYRSIYDELEQNNLVARDEAEAEYDALFGRERGRNYLSTALQTATQFGQSTDVDVPEANTTYIDYMFPKMSRTEVEQAKSPLRQQVAQTVASLEQSGLPAGQAASVLAALQGQVLNEESKIEQNALRYNREQDAKKFVAFKQTADTNNAAFVDGQNRERDLQRQQLAGGTKALQRGINTAGITDTNEVATQRQIQKSFNDNKMNLMMSEQELLGMQNRLESMQSEYQELLDSIKGLQENQ